MHKHTKTKDRKCLFRVWISINVQLAHYRFYVFGSNEIKVSVQNEGMRNLGRLDSCISIVGGYL